ncbi:MAG: hypothetical protein K9M99_11355 [Candidatus Cloacimonetes bacterium]|nr:hypothetical protein [Candidatus Cloacimonadota bacterium]
MRLYLLSFLVLLLVFTGCTVDTDEGNQIVPIEEGNYWIYGISGVVDTLHYERFFDAGPDSRATGSGFAGHLMKMMIHLLLLR